MTTITKYANIVVGWINEVVLRHAPPANTDRFQVVGLHIERSPPDNAIALLQLFVGHHSLLYQLPRRSSAFASAELYRFLCDSRFCFAGVGMEDVRNALRREQGFMVRTARDLGDAASRRLGLEDLRCAGLEQLAIVVMWFFMNKLEDVLNSTWRRRVLNPPQVAHACTEAYLSFELGRFLLY